MIDDERRILTSLRPEEAVFLITIRDIMRARERISRHVLRTPMIMSDYLSDATGAIVYLKLECLQTLNSFKIRGAMNKVLSLTKDERSRGVLAVSSGNHGAAVSYCAKSIGTTADVFVPEGTPETKLAKIRRYGADLHVAGKTYDESHAIAKAFLSKSDKVYIDPASDPVAIAGHGTIGLEIMEDAPKMDVIVVPVGGGGLATGVSLAAKSVQPVSVIGVQTEACPALVASLRDKKLYESYPSAPSICDAVVGGVGEIGYEYAEECLDNVVCASEDSVREAMVDLVRWDKVVSEPSGCLGVAHLLESPETYGGMTVAVVISGGNVDYDLLKKLISSSSRKREVGQPSI